MCHLPATALTISLVFVAGLCSPWSSTCRMSESWSSVQRPRRHSGIGSRRLQRWHANTLTHNYKDRNLRCNLVITASLNKSPSAASITVILRHPSVVVTCSGTCLYIPPSPSEPFHTSLFLFDHLWQWKERRSHALCFLWPKLHLLYIGVCRLPSASSHRKWKGCCRGRPSWLAGCTTKRATTCTTGGWAGSSWRARPCTSAPGTRRQRRKYFNSNSCRSSVRNAHLTPRKTPNTVLPFIQLAEMQFPVYENPGFNWLFYLNETWKIVCLYKAVYNKMVA